MSNNQINSSSNSDSGNRGNRSNERRQQSNAYRQHHNAILAQLSSQFSVEDAFQPLNVPDVPILRRRATRGRESAPATTNNTNNGRAGGQQQQRRHANSFELYEPCLHERTIYKAPEKVPIKVCQDCLSIVVPETAHSVVARAIPLPLSMQRDERWSQLFDIFEDHRALLDDVESLLERQERMLIRLYRWREAYSRDTLVDFDGKDNPMFAVLENSVKRTSNATTGFQQTIESILIDSRRRMLKQVSCCLPRSVDDFVRTTKKRLAEAHPTALYHPNAKQMCTVCDERRCNVLLYSTRPRQDRVADLRSFIFSRSRQRPEEVPRACTCKELCVCLDCLLKWYWESSEALQKSFAKCPNCRAEFHIEDIFPIYEGPVLASSSSGPSSSSSSATTGAHSVDDDGGEEEEEDDRSDVQQAEEEDDHEEEYEEDREDREDEEERPNGPIAIFDQGDDQIVVFEQADAANPFLVGINSVVYEFTIEPDCPESAEADAQ